MPVIHLLSSETIDKIAAGEVVERPSSVVKELVENAIDAGANAITVEARDGGISLIRVTDNGCGMDREQVRSAFLRHATSKIDTAEDLNQIHSLGFRGEALSSIAAVSQVEIITKTRENLTGTRLCLEGGKEKEFQEVGAPDGTTFVMRNLFFNTPVRKKFLKQAPTEGGYVTDLMEHLALSRPDISFKFVLGNQMRFHTSGNGDLKEVIYRIYGREIANSLVPIQAEKRGMKVEGYLGKPVLVRSNRNFEIYYVNGRFIRSTIVAKAIEEGYKEYLMQHKFPFCVLHLTMDAESVDVNVHPTKMDVRFSDQFVVTEFLAEAVGGALAAKEMIPQDRLTDQRGDRGNRQEKKEVSKRPVAEPFEQKRMEQDALQEETVYAKDVPKPDAFEKSPVWERVRAITSAPARPKAEAPEDDFFVETDETETKTVDGKSADKAGAEASSGMTARTEEWIREQDPERVQIKAQIRTQKQEQVQTPEPASKQLDLFEEKILTPNNRALYRIVGQVFDTYWMFQYQDQLCILDQHAAHEKVKYERLMKRYREKEVLSQSLFPPVIVSLSGQEEVVLKECWDVFARLGFEVESFGGNEYALRSVPVDLYGCGERETFLAILDELESGITRQSPKAVEEKIATMACKAAVKGNNRLSREEADKLIDELLTLDNPYHCPHGRPTIITISKYEMEKKFKRIV